MKNIKRYDCPWCGEQMEELPFWYLRCPSCNYQTTITGYYNHFKPIKEELMKAKQERAYA